ncbi:MAG: S1 RNA-binding domain-containing protein [Bacteroidota bacterium]
MTVNVKESVANNEEKKAEKKIISSKELVEDIKQVKEHEIVKGKIIFLTKREAILDVGGKADGVISITELKDMPNPKVGDEVDVYVAEQENKWGDIIISHKMALLVKTWNAIRDAYEHGKALQGTVKRPIKGGLIVDINGIETFLPGSQIGLSPVKDFQEEIGKNIQVQILNINNVKENVIVSRRLLLQKQQEEQRKKVIASLKEGQVLSGTVKNITHFGAFIDLGGIVGLVHKNDISWGKKINSISSVKDEKGEPMFEVGKNIKVVVKKFDLEAGNIYLSTKLLMSNPWDTFSEKVKEGSIVKGKVKEIMEYGAFVELTEYAAITGLLHVSDISHASYLDHPTEVIGVGEEYEFMVLVMNNDEHDLRLGLKQLTPNPWEVKEIIEKYELNSIHEAKARTLVHGGAYLTLEPGIEGFVPNKNLSWTKKIFNPSEVMKKGDLIKIKVLGIDQENKMMLLGMREVEENPWPSFKETFQVGSVHKGTINKKVNGGAIVELPYGIMTFVSSKELVKNDKTEIKEGEELDFAVLYCSADYDKEGIGISHTETYKKTKKRVSSKKGKNSGKHLNFISNEKISTLGDLEALSKLRDELRKKSEDDSKKNTKSKK